MIKLYYMIRRKGKEEYFKKRAGPHFIEWTSQTQGKLFNQKQVVAWIRWYYQSEDHNLEELEVVGYALLEQRTWDCDAFFDKNSKSPLIKI